MKAPQAVPEDRSDLVPQERHRPRPIRRIGHDRPGRPRIEFRRRRDPALYPHRTGRPERGDPYARALTVARVKRAITGERFGKDGKVVKTARALAGGFRFSKMNSEVDAAAVLALEREEMIDLLLTSHWDHGERAASHLQRLRPALTRTCSPEAPVGKDISSSGTGRQAVHLESRGVQNIAKEAQEEGLTQPFHVYARISTYSGPKHRVLPNSQCIFLDKRLQ